MSWGSALPPRTVDNPNAMLSLPSRTEALCYSNGRVKALWTKFSVWPPCLPTYKVQQKNLLWQKGSSSISNFPGHIDMDTLYMDRHGPASGKRRQVECLAYSASV